mgnify:FL=1
MKSVISLFTGCGGLDLGLEGHVKVPLKCINTDISRHWINNVTAGIATLHHNDFNTIFANDITSSCAIAYATNFNSVKPTPTPYVIESIVDLVKKARLGTGPLFGLSADVVTGGFPCQDFSLNGKRRGLSSTTDHTGARSSAATAENRGMLYYWMMQAIDIIRPKCFIAENVKGLALMEDVTSIIRSDFQSIGYVVLPARVLYAPQYGIPQTRERIIFIGLRRADLTNQALEALSDHFIDPSFDPYPKPSHRFIPTRPEHQSVYQDATLAEPVSAGDVLLDLPEPVPGASDLSHLAYSKAAFLSNGSQGQTEINMALPGPTIRSEHHGNIEYRRLSAVHGGRYHAELAAGMPERRLSVRECARLQSFPDDYHFVLSQSANLGAVSMSAAYKLVGNAVPPLLGYHLGRRLSEVWDRLFK